MATEWPSAPPDPSPPPGTSGVAGWLRRNLFASPFDILLTVLATALIAAILIPALQWAVIDAVWRGDGAQVCRADSGHAVTGACWPIIGVLFKVLMIGEYPDHAIWRVAVVALFAGGAMAWLAAPRAKGKWFVVLFMAFVFPVFATKFMLTGLGLEWGQFNGVAALLMAMISAAFIAYVFGTWLALARRSRLPVLRGLAALAIQIGHSLPIQLAAIAAVVAAPIILPGIFRIMPDYFFRILALGLIFATYVAEVIRSGLDAVGDAPYIVARSLGMNHRRAMRFIMLPQARILTTPGMVNTLAGMVKAAIVFQIFSLGLQMQWLNEATSYSKHGTLYAINGLLFFAIGFGLTRYARHLERRLASDPRITDGQRRHLATSPLYADAKQAATSLG